MALIEAITLNAEMLCLDAIKTSLQWNLFHVKGSEDLKFVNKKWIKQSEPGWSDKRNDIVFVKSRKTFEDIFVV